MGARNTACQRPCATFHSFSLERGSTLRCLGNGTLSLCPGLTSAVCLPTPSFTLIFPLSPPFCPKSLIAHPFLRSSPFPSPLSFLYMISSSVRPALPHALPPKNDISPVFFRMRKSQRRSYWGRIQCLPPRPRKRPRPPSSCELPKTLPESALPPPMSL